MDQNKDRRTLTSGMVDLYDVFVDWPARLGREIPAIGKRLASVQAKRVLDVGCGTGQHAAALLKLGYDVHAADLDAQMLDHAKQAMGDASRVHRWALGDAPPQSLSHAGPFDAVLCLGNVWPQIITDPEIRAAAAGLLALLRPGGIVIVGMKAFGVQRERGNPYMPLQRRVHDGRVMHFVRFVDFHTPPRPDGIAAADMHMFVAVGDSADAKPEGPIHSVRAMRVWQPAELLASFAAAGFADVHVSARLDDPHAPAATEDVFVHAAKP